MLHLRSLASVLLLADILLSAVTQAENGIFNSIKVEGYNFIHIADLVRFYQFDSNWRIVNQEVTLRSSTKRFQFKLNTQNCNINGIQIRLNNAPIEYRNSILLSELDVLKTIDPILRPWTVKQETVHTIMLDPGHGGEDQGTTGYRGTREKYVTLDLAIRVERQLRNAGFKTLMTRRRDSYVSLEDRSDMANSSDTDLFVSIHFNSAKPNPQPKGIETYCLTPVGMNSSNSIRRRFRIGTLGEEPGNAFDRNNILLAYLVHQQFMGPTKTSDDRGVRHARFYVIKATECPSVLIEAGYLSNPSEEKNILSPAYREQLATSIVKGILTYAQITTRKNSRQNASDGR